MNPFSLSSNLRRLAIKTYTANLSFERIVGSNPIGRSIHCVFGGIGLRRHLKNVFQIICLVFFGVYAAPLGRTHRGKQSATKIAYLFGVVAQLGEQLNGIQ